MIRQIVVVLAMLLAPAAAMAVEIGEDGLHKQPWFQTTFKDMAEDHAAAGEQGKRFAVIFEQRGCSYCKEMHEKVFSDPEVSQYIADNYFVVQMNLFGDEEVTDFDGEALPEKEMARRWGVVFTPTILFFDDKPPASGPATGAVVQTMPGAFGKWTSLNMFRWVRDKGYEGEEHFQKYHQREYARQTSQ